MVFQIINPLILERIPQEYAPLEARRQVLQTRLDGIESVRRNVTCAENRVTLDEGQISENDAAELDARHKATICELNQVTSRIALLQKTERFITRTLVPAS